MTIKQIEEQLKKAYAAPIEEDGTSQMWNLLPRVPFPELPAKYKSIVREQFTINRIREFLVECNCYPDFDKTGSRVGITGIDMPIDPPQPVDEDTLNDAKITDIPELANDKIITRTRNIATYTIESSDEIVLYGNHAIIAFTTAISNYRATNKGDDHKTRRTIREVDSETAKNLVLAGHYQTIISDKDYRHALTMKKNPNAYMVQVREMPFADLVMQEDGILQLDPETKMTLKQYINGRYEDTNEIDLPLLNHCYTAVIKSLQSYGTHTVTVYQPQFFKAMGVDAHGGKSVDMLQKITSFKNLWGYMPREGILAKVFDLAEINVNNQTMTFTCPYMARLLEKLDEKNHIEKTTKKGVLIDYENPYFTTLVHSTIANERNKAAVELVYLIITGLASRGSVPDSKTYSKRQMVNIAPETVTYSVTFRALLESAPLLSGRIGLYEAKKDKDIALKRAFQKAYQLLITKTDASLYYRDLTISKIIPTMNTLDLFLTITHTGIDGTYKPRT